MVSTTNLHSQEGDTLATFSGLTLDSTGTLKWTVTCSKEIPEKRIDVYLERLNKGNWEQVETLMHFGNRVKGTLTFTKTASKSSSANKPKPVSTTTTSPQHVYSEGRSTNTFKTKTGSTNVDLQKGLNTFRLKMTGSCNGTSAEIKFVSKISKQDYFWIMGTNMYLQKEQYYEIMDDKGDTVLKGTGKEFDISILPKGSYFLYTKEKTLSFNR